MKTSRNQIQTDRLWLVLTLEGIRCTYGDELPKKITQATVCAVICSILATPLTLICIIPVILMLEKVCLILE